MLRMLFFVFLMLLTGIWARAQQEKPARPTLVVGLVVDQMRWDYLYRYYEGYGAEGFKRMIRDGFNCQQTKISHTPSFTAPGHAGIYTGSVPAIHGIVSNNWVDNRTGRPWYCTEDTTVTPVGGSWKAGRMSPRNMMVTTVTDELKLATNYRSRVFGISIKDRGGILPAGHLADGAFWFDDSTGHFISSSYYGAVLPAWVEQFNRRKRADALIARPWELLKPIAEYQASLPDNSAYEGMLPGEKAPVFPHRARDYKTLRYLPAGNTITLEMARACIEGMALGQEEELTDFLCVSLSSPDYAGHMYAPGALELEDMYLRLDIEIAAFLNYLDKQIGKGKYLVFLTADHGAAYNAQMMQDKNVPAGNTDSRAMRKDLNDYIQQEFDIDQAIITLDNYQVYLNESVMPSPEEREKIKRAIMLRIRDREDVAFVTDMEHNDRTNLPEPIRTMVTNGYYQPRSGCIQFIPKPGWYHGYAPTGTTHGVWNPYDTHIPLLWYGWGVKRGETYAPVYMPDIAPTLAALLKIPLPNGCTGSVIKDLLQ